MGREDGEMENSDSHHIGKYSEQKSKHCHSARDTISVDRR